VICKGSFLQKPGKFVTAQARLTDYRTKRSTVEVFVIWHNNLPERIVSP